LSADSGDRPHLSVPIRSTVKEFAGRVCAKRGEAIVASRSTGKTFLGCSKEFSSRGLALSMMHFAFLETLFVPVRFIWV